MVSLGGPFRSTAEAVEFGCVSADGGEQLKRVNRPQNKQLPNQRSERLTPFVRS